MIHNFNGVIKWIGNRSEIKVCLECLKLFTIDSYKCPECGTSNGVLFNELSHHDQEFIHNNQ